MSPADRVPSAATATARIETGAVRPGQAIPKPNLRAALSPELQQEMDEALGDLSLENMLGGGGAAAPVADQIEMDSTRQAKVLSISRDLVFVDLGSRNQGFIPLKQFATPPAAGAQLEVRVSRFDPEEGLYELTLPHGTVSVADWSQVHEGMVVEARITGHNKGGLECEVNNLRGFMPISQISLYRVENIEQFVGQRWPCLITEANPERRNLLLSRRAVLEQEQQEAKEKIFGELAVGQVREGVVRSLRDFGAFVDLGGIDGLIHIGQMSWDRVKHPSDVLEIGQKVKVKIEKIDPDTRKIGLSYRDLTENPWTHAGAKYIVGSAVKGTVSRIMDFGAFVKLEPGIEGLVHISEIAYGRVFRVGDFLKEGQEVEAKVLSVDADAQRISLSIKALMAKPMPVKKDEPELPEEPETPPAAPAKRKVPLKGGLGRGSGGGQVGLNW
ncbi:MAG TPA: S1 RNA-binding domain-containing protein [Pirellulales bacterium]|nr:S1 RNA-binding domain-containing protein [Pirellulales bacterium]